MTKMTRTKYARTHEVVKDDHGRDTVQERATPLPPAMPKYIMCRICRKPVKVGPGQIAFYHKVCRQNRGRDGRRKYNWDKNVIKPSKAVQGTTSGAKERVDTHEPTN